MIKPGVSQVFLTNAEWIALDPVVPCHTTAVSSDTGAQKIGDGVKKWSELLGTGEGMLGRIAVQSSRLPVDNEMLVMCAAQNKWVFRLIGCHLTHVECISAALTIYPRHSVIVETDDSTHIGTGRIKIGDGTTPFGTLPWIGVSTEFIAHLTDTNNPHATTKEQVGLGNVTNDAQLKRSANDYTLITEKLGLASDDFILIEDSEDSFNKKKIKASVIEDMILAYVIALGA